MAGESESKSAGQKTAVTTPDELVRHLREAGAKRVYVSRTETFHDGVIALTATYEFTEETTASGPDSEGVREMLRSVFEAIGEQVWFHNRTWPLDWLVKPAFTDPDVALLPLYDRGVEQKHGDGFNLRNLLFAYETYQQQNGES